MQGNATNTIERRQRSTAWLEQFYREFDQPHPELARVLETRRWEPRDEPFRGFGSPPGKF